MGARTVAVGRSPRGSLAQFADGSSTTALTHASHASPCTVVLVEPDRTARTLTTAGLAELRDSAA